MAEQANISQILAALAAQRPGGTPAQGPPPQQPVPQPYQPSYPSAAPPNVPGVYPLPQPSTSGSVDLSNIKPSNSGSVSLADAVARARGIALEKGISYEAGRGAPFRDSDPRLAGRPFLDSRSRSRSPTRVGRESFRDNYNPYRDERRDEPRRSNGQSFPRDRSFSPGLPGRGGPQSFPPRAFGGSDDRSPPGYGDEGEEYILIDSGLVGLIIGRQGENLRRVEQETQTRVQFITGPDATGPKRQCKIRGTKAQRDDAKAEIARIIEENGNPARGNVPPERFAGGNKAVAGHQPALRAGEDAEQIMVPNRTVGLIIGRGGETIRDLQERSQCHVNIVGPEKAVNGLRPVNLIGTPQAAAMAKELIMEIVDSDTKSMAAQNGPQGGQPRDNGLSSGGPGYGGFGGADSYGEKLNDTITVPSEAVGMIIGKGGETIKDMQTNTGCKINVAQPAGPDHEREIGLVGSRNAIEQAKRAIMEKVYAVEEKNRPGGGARREDPYQDRYSNQQPQLNTAAGYGGQQPHAQAMPQVGAQSDPYEAYGGLANYQMLWAQYYQTVAAQGQAGPGSQGPPGPT
ncbi:hypothetical protein MMC11_000986 [Xylographa trunciseda]|nr:hypothetical protein [Xylographa trunciseda]